MKKVAAIVLVLFLVATVLSFYPAAGMPNNHGKFAVPIISFISVGFGSEKFLPIETFLLHHKSSGEHSDEKSIDLSFSDDYSSSISDFVSVNYSVHISKTPIIAHFPLQNGTINLTIPAQRSYLGILNLSGSTSFPYATLVEEIPSNALAANAHTTSDPLKAWEANIMNFTVQYGNSSFMLYSPGYVQIGNYLSPVSLNIENEKGYSLLIFSFPLNDGNFSFSFNQVMSSNENVNNYVMGFYQVSGFSSPFLTNLTSNAVSLAIGGAIFGFLIIGLFIYYRKK